MFLLVGTMIFAQEEYHDSAVHSLRGLKGLMIELKINGKTPFAGEEYDISNFPSEKIKTDIEQRMRTAGIKVPLLEEYEKKVEDYGGLFIFIGLLETGNDLYTFRIVTAIYQWGYLYKDCYTKWGMTIVDSDAQYYLMKTWDDGYYGSSWHFSEIIEKVMEKVDILINAYLSVNPN
jgi:hypothetical protein